MLKRIILILLTTLLTACAYHDLKAPCTYDSRSGCGPVVPLQQNKF